MNFSTQTIQPFGLVLQSNRVSALSALDIEELKSLVDEHSLVILRGFETSPPDKFTSFGQQLGRILQWNFGEVLELKVDENAANYLFTHGDVPLHWDGAFAEQAPSYQLFQCLKAPDKKSGGETIFTNTNLLLTKHPEYLDEWKGISIDYRTEKKAHYGGSISQSILDQHPHTGAPVIRFAEPATNDTSPLNPLHLTVNGVRNGEHAEWLSNISSLLRDSNFTYVHQWEDGDYILADNHTLLHGRLAFKRESPRHIQRIHII